MLLLVGAIGLLAAEAGAGLLAAAEDSRAWRTRGVRAANRAVMSWGRVIARPTTTAYAPAWKAAASCSGVWIRPSATTRPASASRRMSSKIWPVQEARVRCIACQGCGHKFGASLECPLSLGLGGNVGHDRYAELRSHETDVFDCRQSAGPLAIRSVDRHDVGPGFDERPRIFENGSYVGAGAISVLGDPDDRDGADAPDRGDDLGSRYAQPNGATNFGGPGDCDQTIDPVEWIAWQRLARNDQASGQRLDGSDPLPHQLPVPLWRIGNSTRRPSTAAPLRASAS